MDGDATSPASEIAAAWREFNHRDFLRLWRRPVAADPFLISSSTGAVDPLARKLSQVSFTWLRELRPKETKKPSIGGEGFFRYEVNSYLINSGACDPLGS